MPNDVQPDFLIEFITIPGSNYTVGRGGSVPTAIVIHITEGSKQATLSWFKNSVSQVSSHFLVCKDGATVQFVNTANTAYANGRVDKPVSELVLATKVNPNNWTISIEHEGVSSLGLTDAQYETSSKLVKFLHAKWNIPLNRTHVFGHREVYSLKTCPGVSSIERIIRGALY